MKGGKKCEAIQICVVHKLGPRGPSEVSPFLYHCLPDTEGLKGWGRKHVLIIFNSISPFFGLNILHSILIFLVVTLKILTDLTLRF